jgi:Ca2+-transporting ATPase
VERSRAEHGENVLTPPKRTSFWRLYLEKYEDPIIRILLVAAVISLGLAVFSGEYVETIGIILAVLFATTVGFYFERDAAKKFDVLTALGEEQPVKVIRDGKPQQIARRDVVVGDIVVVETGDEIPADGRLFEATDLQVDESSLTGEQLTTENCHLPSSSPNGDFDQFPFGRKPRKCLPRRPVTPLINGDERYRSYNHYCCGRRYRDRPRGPAGY